MPDTTTLPSRRTLLRVVTAMCAATLLPARRARATDDGFRDLAWKALIPADWDASAPLRHLRPETLDDADPRAQQALAAAREYWKAAPVDPSLQGARVRMRGYVVPMSGDATIGREFLLVPYFGACIHVPPPPANQVVHVRMDAPPRFRLRTMSTVWVSGVLRVERSSSVMGDAGYAMRGIAVDPYVRG